MRKLYLVIVLLACSIASAAQNSKTVFLVRHAEKVSSAKDALLSDLGHQRAECLAGVLADADIKNIMATNVVRTQQTAQPLATRLHEKIAVLPASDIGGFATEIRNSPGNSLVVVHSDTLPAIIHQLTGKTVTVGANDYDVLYIVSFDPNSTVPVLLHYCTQLNSAAAQPGKMLR
jgi:broad specificity phosphatase PhoE